MVEVKYSNIMIFSPHCDDDIIIAGGYANRVLEKEGTVNVVYLTNTDDRLREENTAWDLVTLGKRNLIPLGFEENIESLLDKKEEILNQLRLIICEHHPQAIFIPLYEGGHAMHDLTNYLVSTVVKHSFKNIVLYECPEYNYYFSFTNTPEKISDIFSKLIPFFEYHAPPTFLESGKHYYLKLSHAELVKKISMLKQFKSEKPKDLIMHFGFDDRFKLYSDHDYTQPPHDYGNKFIRYCRYGENDHLKRLFSRPYWKYKTIYSKNNLRDLSGIIPEANGQK